jgi:hypothetical protein
MGLTLRRRGAGLSLLAALLIAGCGGSDEETAIEASSPADEELAAAIVAELDGYNESFDLTSLPPDQQAELGPIVDNLPPAGGGVDTLVVTDGVVEAETGFAPDPESEQTARLICGAIMRSVDPGNRAGHRVLGEGGVVLADCEPEDANLP